MGLQAHVQALINSASIHARQQGYPNHLFIEIEINQNKLTLLPSYVPFWGKLYEFFFKRTINSAPAEFGTKMECRCCRIQIRSKTLQ